MMPTGKILYHMVDLHGMSTEQAQSVVEYWLGASASKAIGQIRFVTGRGNHLNANNERGTLYNNFLNWIEQSLFKGRIERCDKHDGYFEIKLKSTQTEHPITEFFKTTAQQIIVSNLEIIKNKAEKGEPYFQMMYAQLLEGGTEIEQDFKQAVKYYKLAADNLYPAAMHELARCYFHGVGVRQNDKEAVEWLKKADKLDFIDSTVSLGDSYFLGNGVEEDDRIAISYYAKAAARGHRVAMRKLANAYNQGYGITKNVENSFKWYKKSADLDDPISLYNVGVMYESGLGVKQDPKLAWEYLQKSAIAGDPDGQCMVGTYYLEGREPVAKDQTKALEWLQKAADNGSKPALHQLSLIGDEKSQKTYLEKSAKAGNFLDKMRLVAKMPMEKNQFGRTFTNEIKKNCDLPVNDIVLLDYKARFILIDYMLLQGKDKHQKKAIQALETMAEEKCIFSLRRLVMIYMGDLKVLKINRDLEKVIQYCKKAIELGDSKSMMTLGELYQEGHGVNISTQTALEYYQKAAQLLNPNAFLNIALIILKDDSEDVSEEDLRQVQEYATKAIIFEQQRKSIQFLQSGIIDEYIPVTEDAISLLNTLLTTGCIDDFIPMTKDVLALLEKQKKANSDQSRDTKSSTVAVKVVSNDNNDETDEVEKKQKASPQRSLGR